MKIKVTQNEVKIEKAILNDGEYRIHECEFELPEEFNGLVQKAVFWWEENEPYRMNIINCKCNIPIEVLHDGILKIGVYAFETVNDKLELRYSPSADTIRVYEGSYVANAQNSEGGTPSEFEQLESKVQSNTNNISSLQDVTSTHTTQIETLQTDVNNIKAEQITQNQNIQTNANNIQTNTTDIASIKSEQITQNQNISQNASDITDIKSEQVTQNTNIQNNTNDITTLQNDLSSEITNRQNADINLQSQIDAITSSSDVVDIVGTYAQLQSYDTQHLQNNDVIKVLQDETHDNAMTYYRWLKNTSTWQYIGQEGPYYTKSEADTLLQGKANVNDVYSKSQIDTKLEDYALKSDLTDFVTEEDVDTKLEDYVETTTYTQGQATQDANIEENATNINWLQTLVNQMPTVSGQGTDLSLQDVLNYRLMKFLPQGSSSQFSTEGKQLFNKLTVIAGALQANGTVNASTTLMVSDYIEIDSTKQYYKTESGSIRVKLYDENKIVISTSSNSDINGFSAEGVYSIPFANAKYIRISMTNELVDTLMFAQSDTATSYEPYTGRIPAPNPSYPYPVKSVTGENSLVISNSDNTETQSYSISLGNIELNSSPDGTIRDGIYGTPNNWFKREYIGKVVLDGSEESWAPNNNNTLYGIAISNIYSTTSTSAVAKCLSNYFTAGTVVQSQTYEYILSVYNGKLFFNPRGMTLEQFKTWLSTHNTIVYYVLATPQDIPITDTTLINQLNDIYNNAHSYNGVTNITTTYADGNEQMYLDIEALKNVWSEV